MALSRSRSPRRAGGGPTAPTAETPFLLDVDGEAAESDVNRVASYDDIQLWAHKVMQRICSSDPDLARLLRHNLERKVCITTHYSGIGTAEMAAAIVELAAQSHFSLDAANCFRVHAASDIDPTAQHVLLSGVSTISPSHVFGDVCFPAPVACQQRWRSWLTTTRQEIERACSTPQERLRMIERKGSQIFSLIQRDLHKLTSSRNFKQHCIKCGKYCPRFPSLSSLSGALQIDISGSTCVGFTTAGKQWQLLDDSIIPFAIWCWTVKSVKPDLIIHECVTGFPVTLLDAALNHDEAPPLYQVSTCVFDTTDLGIPVKRKRRYTVCRRLPSKAVAEYSLRSFQSVSFQELELDGDAFFRASACALQKLNSAMAGLAHLPASNRGELWPWEALLRVGQFNRLQEARDRARQRGLAIAFCSIMQSSEFMSLSEKVPTLMTNSIISACVLAPPTMISMSSKQGQQHR